MGMSVDFIHRREQYSYSYYYYPDRAKESTAVDMRVPLLVASSYMLDGVTCSVGCPA